MHKAGIWMIMVNGQKLEPDELFKLIKEKERRTIVKKMAVLPQNYDYQSIDELKFELKFRENTMNAAKQLNKSGVHFTTFLYAFPNKKYWQRLLNGGFLLRSGITPSTAILDILKNGKLYAFECSTAIAIVLYIATLYTIGADLFNLYFKRLYLFDWQFDEDLPVFPKEDDDFIPGDVLHFNNPDFDPKQPHWRAENVIYFGDDKYYGHGVGIKNAPKIIEFLNKKRKSNPTESAYLMRQVTRPVYRSLFMLTMQN